MAPRNTSQIAFRFPECLSFMSRCAFRRVHAQTHKAHISALGVGFHLRGRSVGSLKIGLRRPLPQGFHATPHPIVICDVFVHRTKSDGYLQGFHTTPHPSAICKVFVHRLKSDRYLHGFHTDPRPIDICLVFVHRPKSDRYLQKFRASPSLDLSQPETCSAAIFGASNFQFPWRISSSPYAKRQIYGAR